MRARTRTATRVVASCRVRARRAGTRGAPRLAKRPRHGRELWRDVRVRVRVRVSAGECYVCCIAVHPLLHRQKAFLPPNLFLFPKQLTTVNQDAHSTVALADVVSKTLSPTHRRIGLAGGNEKRSTRDVFKTISQFLPRKARTHARTHARSSEPGKTSGNVSMADRRTPLRSGSIPPNKHCF